jgi:hypothetical protein
MLGRLGCSLVAMAEESAKQPIDIDQLVVELKGRVETERAAGAYADDLSELELEPPGPMEQTPGSRVRFRPELGFSSKPVIGPVITLVKRVILRLQFYVMDDLARQADAAITNVEGRLAAEIATRERLESEMEAKIAGLEAQIRLLEDRNRSDGEGV